MDYNELFRQAKRELGLAEHILTVTLPFVKDTKIYFNVLEHVNSAVLMSIRAFLAMKKDRKEIRIIPSSNELARQLFFETYMDDLQLSVLDEKMLSEMNHILEAHSKSQAELKRGGEFVIVLPSYDTVTVNQDQIRKYLKEAKGFIDKTEKGMI